MIVSDASGNVLAGQWVSWEIVQSGSMTLSNVKTSRRQRQCLLRCRAWANGGIVTLKVKAQGIATFSFTVNLKIGSLVKTGGDLQSAEPGSRSRRNGCPGPRRKREGYLRCPGGVQCPLRLRHSQPATVTTD